MANLPSGVTVDTYSDKWKTVLRSVGQELRSLTDILLKWMAYDQGIPANTGSKWTDEEQELLKRALILHGDDMDKICEMLSSRSEQAIRAAIKRKMDPAFVQLIGPMKRRRHGSMPDTHTFHDSPLASYFANVTKAGDGDAKQVVNEGNSAGQQLADNTSASVNVNAIGADQKAATTDSDHNTAASGPLIIAQIAKNGEKAKSEPVVTSTLAPFKSGVQLPSSIAEVEGTGWTFPDSEIELTDYDFLAILEDDPVVLAEALTISGVPAIDLRVRSEAVKAEEILREQDSDAPDIIFWNNFKAPLRELALDLGVFAERNGIDEDEVPKETEQVIVDGPVLTVPEEHDMVNGLTIHEHFANSYESGLTGSEIEDYLMETDAAVEQLQSAEFL